MWGKKNGKELLLVVVSGSGAQRFEKWSSGSDKGPPNFY